MSVEKNIQMVPSFTRITNFEDGFIIFGKNETARKVYDLDFLKKSEIIDIDLRNILMTIRKNINEKCMNKIYIDLIDYCDDSTFRLKGNKVIDIVDNTTGHKISKTIEDFDIQIHLLKLYYHYIKCLVDNRVDENSKYHDYYDVEFRYLSEYTVKHNDSTKSSSRLFRTTKDVSNKPYFHSILTTDNYITTFIESFVQDLTEIIVDQLNAIEEKRTKVSNIYNDILGENCNVRCRSELE